MNRYKYSSNTYNKEGEWAIVEIPCDSCLGTGYEPTNTNLRILCTQCAGNKYSNKYQYVRFDSE